MSPERIKKEVHKTVSDKNMELMFAPQFALSFPMDIFSHHLCSMSNCVEDNCYSYTLGEATRKTSEHGKQTTQHNNIVNRDFLN